MLHCLCEIFLLYFFFCKQKTAYEMRISDWSSDVCSSDLAIEQAVFLDCVGPVRRLQKRLITAIDAAAVGRQQFLILQMVPEHLGLCCVNDVLRSARCRCQGLASDPIKRNMQLAWPLVEETWIAHNRSEDGRVEKECVRSSKK